MLRYHDFSQKYQINLNRLKIILNKRKTILFNYELIKLRINRFNTNFIVNFYNSENRLLVGIGPESDRRLLFFI